MNDIPLYHPEIPAGLSVMTLDWSELWLRTLDCTAPSLYRITVEISPSGKN